MISRFYENNKDLSLVLGMIAILVILFAPIPSVALDLAIIAAS
jgi:flagellar biosynthesis protein FlhA